MEENVHKACALKIEGSGCVNGVDYTASGDGNCDPGTGRISFEVSFSRIAAGTDPLAHLLGVLIIPTVFGRELGDSQNLLTLTRGEFLFTQVMVGDGIAVKSEGSMSHPERDQLLWRATAHGEVRLPAVSAIEPFTAIMIPQGAGKMLDVLSIPLIQNGERRVVHAIRTFTFRPSTELRRAQLRRIAVEPRGDGLFVAVSIESQISTFPEIYGSDAAG